jgi:hypothetical protein
LAEREGNFGPNVERSAILVDNNSHGDRGRRGVYRRVARAEGVADVFDPTPELRDDTPIEDVPIIDPDQKRVVRCRHQDRRRRLRSIRCDAAQPSRDLGKLE